MKFSTEKQLIFSFLLMLNLASCASHHPPLHGAHSSRIKNADHHLSRTQPRGHWQLRHQLAHWQLEALMGGATHSEAFQANLKWIKQGDRYHIDLFGPFGAGAVKIDGRPGQVIITDANHLYRAPTAEALLFRVTGWQFPISHLNYWIQGLPTPNVKAHAERDRQGRLTRLEQNGWIIIYRCYQHVNQRWLPSLIKLEHRSLSLKFKVKQWVI